MERKERRIMKQTSDKALYENKLQRLNIIWLEIKLIAEELGTNDRTLISNILVLDEIRNKK